MKASEYKNLDGLALKKKADELREELFRLRLKHATGQLEKTNQLRSVRRDVARLETWCSARNLGRTV